MLIELGNHHAHRSIDGRPSVTTIHIPDADENGLGGYTHEPGLAVAEFQKHVADAILNRDGITHLPEHEALVSIAAAWPRHARDKPQWVKVHPNLEGYTHHGKKKGGLKTDKVAEDIENFLREHWGLDNEKPLDYEDRYWTKWGPPGHGPRLPHATALFLNDGRVQQANNYGGGQVGDTGQATAASATTLTTGKSYTANQWAGYRVYATVSGSQMVWGNVISNTAGPNSVLTVDRWYNPAAPGGAAGTTPYATAAFLLADGGNVSAWFIGLTTTNVIPAATDHALSGEYTAAGGGMVRKIAPFSITSGTSPVTFTLTPVYTANGSDTLPSTFYAIIASNSMVVSNTALSAKFESSLSSAQTVSATGDQLTVTLTESGS